MVLFGVIDRVLGDIDSQIRRDDGLAAQARLRLQSPGPVEQVVFTLFDPIKRIKALAYNAVACRACTAQIAGMLYFDAIFQQRLADRDTWKYVYDGALRRQISVGKYRDSGQVFLGDQCDREDFADPFPHGRRGTAPLRSIGSSPLASGCSSV